MKETLAEPVLGDALVVSFRQLILAKIIGISFLFLSLVPWLSLGFNNLDSQPWAFIFSLIFLFFIWRGLKAPRYSLALLTFIAFGVFFAILLTEVRGAFAVLRAVISYLSVPLIYIAAYNYILRYGFPIKLLLTVNYIWLLIGILELYIPYIGGVFSGQRTTPDRGVTSLAPEPTYFAIYLFFSSWILFQSRALNNWNLVGIKKILLFNFLGVVFLAKSSMVMVFYLIVILYFFLSNFFSLHFSKKAIRRFVFIIFFAAASLPVVFYFLEGSRLAKLSSLLFTDFSFYNLAYHDASINQRVEAIYFSVVGGLNNFLIPGGLDSFAGKRDYLLEYTGGFFWNLTNSDKIMSWVGAFIYELGLFGLLSIILLFAGSYYKFSGSKAHFLILFVVLFSAIPVAFPLVPILFALYAIQKRLVSTQYASNH